jgi:hypothetical protein
VRLTRDQRKALFRGDYQRITGEGPCPFQIGKPCFLSSRFWITPTGIKGTPPGEWELLYTVSDHRDRFLASGVPAMAESERETGMSWTDDLEQGYTGNPHTRLADAGTAVPREVQEEQTKEAHRKWALYESEERALDVAQRQQRAISNKIRRLMTDAAKTGVDITPHLAKALRDAEDEVANARKAAA